MLVMLLVPRWCKIFELLVVKIVDCELIGVFIFNIFEMQVGNT